MASNRSLVLEPDPAIGAYACPDDGTDLGELTVQELEAGWTTTAL